MVEAHAPSLTVEGLYRQHHGWLHGWLMRKLCCAHRAADLAQDTFLRVLTARLPEDLREPRAYLTTIGHRLLTDHWRRLALEQAYEQALACLPAAQVPAPEVRLQVLESLQQIDACLQALPLQTRQVFLSSQLDGLAYADIAAQWGISLSTVKRHMSRAFLALLNLAP